MRNANCLATRLVMLGVFGILSGPHSRAQSPRSEFEVASIKRNTSGDLGRYIRPGAGRLSVSNMTVKDLLTIAYQVRDFQISGGPTWINSEHYDIEAKTDGNAAPKQMAETMLQALLEDRFKLKVHRETKELPIYVLTLAKNGLKIEPAKEGSCITLDPGKPAAPGQRQSAFCGFHVIGRGRYDATHTGVSALATDLSSVLSRTVADKTALTEAFDIHLRFAPEDAPDSTSPSIFTAVQEQLGLRLEAGKGPVEVLVIDQVGRPSEN
jgi:uncharacterized protein (TIGR03435 family)